jgi:hypothetical protein
MARHFSAGVAHLRGLVAGRVGVAAAITQGSRTRPGLHAVTRYAGCCPSLHYKCANHSVFRPPPGQSPNNDPVKSCACGRPLNHTRR